jgi:hypothetical protein
MAKPTKEQKEESKKVEDWMTTKWRPMMAVMYMCVCTFDFIIAPILWSIIQFWEIQSANDAFRQWQPLTLQGAGLFHMAMGAVLGITAWSRGQEKLAGVANGPTTPSTPSFGGGMTPTSFGSPSTPSFGAPAMQQTSFTSTSVSTGFGGKLAPPPAFQPEI